MSECIHVTWQEWNRAQRAFEHDMTYFIKFRHDEEAELKFLEDLKEDPLRVTVGTEGTECRGGLVAVYCARLRKIREQNFNAVIQNLPDGIEISAEERDGAGHPLRYDMLNAEANVYNALTEKVVSTDVTPTLILYQNDVPEQFSTLEYPINNAMDFIAPRHDPMFGQKTFKELWLETEVKRQQMRQGKLKL